MADIAEVDLRTATDLVMLAWDAVHVRWADEHCEKVIGDLLQTCSHDNWRDTLTSMALPFHIAYMLLG
jgi:hypothetical protein